MTFGDLLSDACLLWVSRWLWRTGQVERRAKREIRRDIRELTETYEGTA